MSTLKQAVKRIAREALLVYLLVSGAVAAFYAFIWFVPPEGQISVWPLALLSEPWAHIFDWLLINYPVGPRLMPAAHSGSVAICVALNVTLAYVVGRFIWLGLRPNNSFKPKPLRGSA